MTETVTTNDNSRPPSAGAETEPTRLAERLAALEDLALAADCVYATLRGLMQAELWETSIALESTLRAELAGAKTEFTATLQEAIHTYLSVARRLTHLSAHALRVRRRATMTVHHDRTTQPPAAAGRVQARE